MFYRKEIDGLRAIAVLAVMLFHAHIPFFTGGFVGVDIFFVISGYLITQIIMLQLRADNFSFAEFYARRARRILPALFAMMLICLPIAWWVLIHPADLKDFFKSVFAVPVYVSNILFWRESGYFDQSALLKPFLHTWSLSVEEQYYLIFPVYLLILCKFGLKHTWWCTLLFALLSLWFAQWGSSHQPSFNFYWLPARMWELLAGALIPMSYQSFNRLIDAPAPGQQRGVIAEFLGLFGCVLIIFSIFFLDEKIIWPSLFTLLPVVGTVLLILFSSSQTRVGQMLSCKPMVAIGLMSYSAYLWHQPVLAFARYHYDALSLLSRAALVMLALFLGWLSWRFVERPFRNRQKWTTQNIFIFTLVASMFFVVIGWTGYVRSGFLFRLPTQTEPVFAYDMKAFMKDIRSDVCFIQLGSSITRYSDVCFLWTKPAAQVTLVPTVLWGDSHAAALYAGFKKQLGDVVQFTAGSCPPIFWDVHANPSCQALNMHAMHEIERLKPAAIYLQANWFGYPGDSASALKTVRQIRQWLPDVRLVLIGDVPEWPKGLPRQLLQSTHHFTEKTYARVPDGMFLQLEKSDQLLKAFAHDAAIEFISARDLLCKQQDCLAVTMTQEGPRLTAFDYGHLTKAGSENLVQVLITGR